MSYFPDPNYVHRSHSHSHSYQSSSGYLPPVGADPQLWQYFAGVDTNRSGALSLGELQNALVNGTDLPMFSNLSDRYSIKLGNWSSNLTLPCFA